MRDSRTPSAGSLAVGTPHSGSGAPCPEAQPDGVPCHQLIDCDDCDHSTMATPAAVPPARQAPHA